ncbi:endolytic transglycosylase MltG [Periweissella cryptocerci]|uniref:Endolytic murein transglycosylase n=1 Tax=Periweissella cryptocerci TaxID=2506420 RepID=A0A4P6YW23_9LACO|nr:endolytic transglycosylase MltG [Periweissella cryptocerci]QBO36937.1 endolytic transglycosylase MltG [Periweissella cryptocerci]
MAEADFTPRNEQYTPAKKSNVFVTILKILVILVIVVGAAAGGYYLHLRNDTSALSAKSTKKIEFHVVDGSSSQQIATSLQKKGVIKHDFAFDRYVAKNNINDLKAGYFELSPNMDLATIAKALQQPGAQYPANTTPKGFVLMREGETAEQFAKTVAAETKFSAKDWLATLNDPAYLKRLHALYPELLDSAMKAKGTRYKLEGYLFPATYDVRAATKPSEITTQMVTKTNQVMQPYFGQMKQKKLSVQEVLTLASLVEREAITPTDRAKVAGVFFNRLDTHMTLGSDISVKYALDSDKTNLNNKDTQVKSPYNLYTNQGYGPGPFNSPSLESIEAVLKPLDRDKKFYYFIADLKSGKVYFTHNLVEHEKLNAKLYKINHSK